MARVDNAVRGQSIELPRDDALADWTYASDAAQAAWLALSKPRLSYDLYNVVSQRSPVGEFTRVLRKLLPDADIRTSAGETPGHAHSPMNNERLVKDLGFAPVYSLERGVRDYIERIRAYDQYCSRNS
jgi:nucleoside-diphosphate-sugar epimerase